MRVLTRACLSLAAALAVAGPAAGQDHNVAAGYGIGIIQPGALNPGAGAAEASMDAGIVGTAFGEAWHMLGGRLGARLNVAFARRPLQLGEASRDISALAADVNIMARLLPPTGNGSFAPFVSAGAGVFSYGLGRGAMVQYEELGAAYPGEGNVRFAVVGGAGVDIAPPQFRLGESRLGIRLEVANHIVLRSPFRGLEGERLGPIHNMRAGISLIGLGWF
jgi:hypothetical protein